MERLPGLIFFGIGLVMLAVALVIGGLAISFRMGAERVTGTVSEVELRHYSDGNSYCPIVQYNTRLGQTYSHNSDVCSWPPSFEVGQLVTIYYDPANPSNSQLDSFMGVWFIPALFTFMGGVFGTIGYFFLFPNVLRQIFKK
jgi:hypothetical protein